MDAREFNGSNLNEHTDMLYVERIHNESICVDACFIIHIYLPATMLLCFDSQPLDASAPAPARVEAGWRYRETVTLLFWRRPWRSNQADDMRAISRDC